MSFPLAALISHGRVKAAKDLCQVYVKCSYLRVKQRVKYH